jgi:transcription initiation factor TFIIB
MEEKIENINNLSYNDIFDLMDEIDFEEEKLKIPILSDGFCTNCNSNSTIIENFAEGIMVCNKCGNIFESIMDTNPEWRNYEDSANVVGRCSGPTNPHLPKSSIGTSMACHPKSKLKILHGWIAMPYDERSLYTVIKEIQFRCRKSNIVKCIEDDATIMYKHISEYRDKNGKKKIIRGSNRKSLVAACVFFACKKDNQTRSPKEIAHMFDLKYKDITKGFKTFETLMKLRSNNQLKFNSSLPEDFIPRYCRDLDIPKQYIGLAVRMTINTRKLNIASIHTPLSIATGTLLLLSHINDLKITKRDISKSFGVSEVTLSKIFKRVLPYKDIIISDKLTNHIIEKTNKKRETITLPDHLKTKYDELLKEIGYCNVDDNIEEYVNKSLKINKDININTLI